MLGAVFDVDGTMLDSMQIWWDAAKEYFKSAGAEFDDASAMEVRELSLGESLPMLLERYGIDDTVEEATNRMKRYAEIGYREYIPLKAGCAQYIRQLKKSGIKIAVATSGYEELCRAAFKRLGILDCIDAFAFSHEAGGGKQTPAVYELAAKRLGLNPRDCMVFEDIEIGIKSAKSAGFETCAVYDATNADITDVLKQSADHYITGWEELLRQPTGDKGSCG